MSTRASKDHFTYQDYLGFPDDGQRYEVIFGEKLVNPSPVIKHQRICLELAAWLRGFHEIEVGHVFIAPIDVLLADDCVVVPDLIFIATDRSYIIEESRINGAPDIVVEVLSPSSRSTDQMKKRRLYERSGVQEYWIVDPDAEEISRLVLRNGEGFHIEGVYSGESVLASPLLPGRTLQASAIFH